MVIIVYAILNLSTEIGIFALHSVFRLDTVLPMSEITALRKSVNWHQKELAKRLGVDQSTISRWESGKTSNKSNFRNRLAVKKLVEDEIDENVFSQAI